MSIASVTGTIRVKSSDGTTRDFNISSPGEMIALVHQVLQGSLHLAEHQRQFALECLDFSPDYTKDVGGLNLVDAFSAWCKDNKITCPVGRNSMYRMLEEWPGVVRTNPHNKTSFRGLKLLAYERVKANIEDSDLI